MSGAVKRVYKFYDAKWGMENLAERHLKISQFDDLNDPFEAQFISFSDRESRLNFKRSMAKMYSDKGIICFSESWHNPVIWSHYADKHKGVALGFDIPTDKLLKVRYRKQRLPYPGILNKSPGEAFKLVENALLTKFKHWEYENEFRVMVPLTDKAVGSDHYFKAFGNDLILKEVVLGPACTLTSSAVLSRLNEQLTPNIVTTRLAFSSYRVVRQRAAHLQK